MPPDALVSCPGVLALELTPGAGPANTALERDAAEKLAAFVAEDLRTLLPEIGHARLALVGAHFDSTELLRPGFPVFAALTGLAMSANIDAASVLAFGTHDGHMPAAPLIPDAALSGGALRVVPWTLLVPAALAGNLVGTMESDLGGRGDVGTRTADCMMRSFDMRLEHARYFTPHDLMAMVSVHYEHMNLAPLWSLIEAALLTPERAEKTMSAHGLIWRQVDAHATAQTPGTWLAATTTAVDERAHALAGIVFELRQYVALLAAHRMPVDFADAHYDNDGQFVVDTLAAPDAGLPPARLYAHEAPGLGVIALSVAQAAGGHAHMLAHAWPLAPDLAAACQYLATAFGCPSEPERLGRVLLDVTGHLGVPAADMPL